MFEPQLVGNVADSGLADVGSEFQRSPKLRQRRAALVAPADSGQALPGAAQRQIVPDDPEREIDAIQFDPFASPWVLNRDPAGAVEVAAHAAEPSHISNEPAAQAPPASTSDLRGAVNAYEKALLEEALARHRYNQRSTAAALGLSYDQLRHAMKRHQLALSAAG